MTQRQPLHVRFAEVLEGNLVEKGMILPVFLVPLFLQYLLWAYYVTRREDSEYLVDVVFLSEVRPVFWSFVAAALFLIGLGLLIRRRWPDAIWYQHCCALFLSLTLIYCGYVIGSLSFAAGVVLAAAPMFGFILLERQVIYLSWSVALLTTLVSAYAAAIGLLQYGPAWVPPTPGDSLNQLFWTSSTLFFAAPYMIGIVVLADVMLVRWRDRETAFRTLSYTDPLTGVHNRRSILDMLEREVARRHRRGPPVSVVLVDLDHFKRVNDTWGHPVGDEVLRVSARALAESLRQSDAVGRYGGEEFLLVLPDTDTAGAAVIAERCRQRLVALQVRADNGEAVPVTGSFGLASNARDPEMGLDALVRAADEALYRAKEGGRNRIETVS